MVSIKVYHRVLKNIFMFSVFTLIFVLCIVLFCNQVYIIDCKQLTINKKFKNPIYGVVTVKNEMLLPL